MDFRQLTHFVGVANHGGFSKAARMLHVSQPALSRSVQLIEATLDVSLFDRTPQGVELTEDGDTLYRHACLIINSVQSAKDEIRATKGGGFGEVKVGIASLFSNFLVDDAITYASKTNTNFSASIKVGLYEDMADQLQEGLLDLIVTTDTETSSYKDVDFENLCEISGVLVAGKENPLSRKKSVSLEALKDEPWVMLNQLHMESFLTTFFAQAGVTAPRCKVKTSSLNMVRSLIRKQHFVGFLPTHWIREDLKTGVLAVINAPGLPVNRMAGIVTRQKSILNKSASLLVDGLRLAAEEFDRIASGR